MTAAAAHHPAPHVARIELRLNDLTQLFNSLDPSPFLDKDLDADAEEFITGWARELPRDRPLEIVIHLNRLPKEVDTCVQCEHDVREAVRHFFTLRADHERRQFSELMRIGRTSMLIGLLFVAACVGASNLIRGEGAMRDTLRESLIIVGWVALWRPLEIFLYDWWPIRRHMRLFRRLSEANVTVNAPPNAS